MGATCAIIRDMSPSPLLGDSRRASSTRSRLRCFSICSGILATLSVILPSCADHNVINESADEEKSTLTIKK